jgi:hypothetical protein
VKTAFPAAALELEALELEELELEALELEEVELEALELEEVELDPEEVEVCDEPLEDGTPLCAACGGGVPTGGAAPGFCDLSHDWNWDGLTT